MSLIKFNFTIANNQLLFDFIGRQFFLRTGRAVQNLCYPFANGFH